MRTKTPLQAEKILRSAARLFAAHRFHEARMEDIAAEAEVGKGTVYRYFKDKEELYTALLDRAAEQMSCRVHAAVEKAVGARARTEALVAALLDFFEEQPHLFDLVQHAEALRGPDGNEAWREARSENIRLVREIFEEAGRDGEFPVADPELASLLLLGSLRAVLRFGERPHPRDLPRRIVNAFFHGIGHG